MIDPFPAPVPIVKIPSECTPEELEAFRQMLIKGGEVIVRGLPERIRRAHQLSFVYVGSSLAAIGAVKAQDPGYQADAFHKAKTDASPEDYAVELGWVYVDDEFQGHKLSRAVVKTLLPFFGTVNCYATSKKSRGRMHAILKRFGFIQSGAEFPSRLANENLLLFLRTGQSNEDI